LAYSKITGVPAFLTSYTETDPYRVTSVAVSGTSTKTITLTRADASTVTTTWTDIDTDTNTYVTSAGFSGGTLTLTRNDAGTVTVSLDGRYYLASNPSGYISSYTETDTLSSVTGRGASTSTAVTFSGAVNIYNTDSNDFRLYYQGAASGSARVYYHQPTNELRIYTTAVTSEATASIASLKLYINSVYREVWHAGNLTNNNQLTNGAGYITGYTETDTLASVTSRGASTSTRTTFTEVGATREGSDSVAVGPWFRWTNVAENRQMLTQLNASFGLTTWAYNGSAWVSVMTLTQGGVLNTAATINAGDSVTLLGELYWGGTSSGQKARAYTTGASGSATLNYAFWNGSSWPIVSTLSSAGAVTFNSTISASNFSGSSSGTNTGDQTNISGNAATAGTSTYASYLNALGSYIWSHSSTPSAYHLGITSSFVSGTEGFQSYGSVMTMKTYSGGGGSLQLYVPYSPTYGGSAVQVRFGNYDAGGNIWTSWKTLIDSGNIGSQTVASAGNATTAGGLAVHTGTNNVANQIVRTDVNGYIQAGWINTISGDNGTSALTRIYASDDAYLRFYTPANFRQVLDVPTRTGGSASGSWSINAATATSSSQLGGLTKSQLWNNSGNSHGAFTSFAGPSDFGNYFIHQDAGVNDGPAGNLYQYYSTSVGLGNDYSYSQYVMQTAVNRYGYCTPYYTWVRFKESGTWQGWNKMAAGYADSAGSLSSMNISQFTNNSGYVTTSGLSTDADSEQTVGGRIHYFNSGAGRMNVDSRWNESGYDADNGCLHIWSWTAAGVAYGRAGIALFSDTAYQYLTTKSGTTGIFLNNNAILHAGNYTSYVYSQATSNSIYSRKDTTNQWIKPYYEYGQWLTSEAPSTLTSQMGGGGLRVDFMNNNTGDGSWSHVMTWSGYSRYSMSQIGTNYNTTDARLYYRQTNAHTDAWLSWKEFVFTSGNTPLITMSGPIRRSTSLAAWFEGTYNNVGDNSGKSNPIYTIGSAYNPADANLGNMYGIGYAHPNFWGSGKVGGWGLYVASAGVFDVILGGDGSATSIWAKTDIVAYSDIRVKENIEVITNALEKVQAIRGVTFTRNDVKDKEKRSAGVIAQEVLKVLPEVVTGTEEDMYSVAYGNMAALFIEAIKEQKTKI
jgi:hypothetical protein